MNNIILFSHKFKHRCGLTLVRAGKIAAGLLELDLLLALLAYTADPEKLFGHVQMEQSLQHETAKRITKREGFLNKFRPL